MRLEPLTSSLKIFEEEFNLLRCSAPRAGKGNEMKKLVRVGLLSLGLGFAFGQEETYQVPGFPPFAPAPKMPKVVEDKGDTAVVRHLMGETEIPKNPQRVYADASTLEILLSLDITPVASNYIDYATVPEAVRERTRDVTRYPKITTNLETVVAEQPDLILVADFNDIAQVNDTGLYQQLSAIAPTVVLSANTFGIWEQATRNVAEMFGLGERAEKVLADFQEAIQRQCDRIREVIGEDNVAVSLYINRDFYLIAPGLNLGWGYTPFSQGRIYSRCGFAPSPRVAELVGTERSTHPLSLEALPEIQDEHLIVQMYPNTGTDFAELTGHNLWQGLPAVQQGNVHRIDDYIEAVGYYSTLESFTRMADIITGAGE